MARSPGPSAKQLKTMRSKRSLALAMLSAAAIAATGCGEDGGASGSPTFGVDDLQRLVLSRSEGPQGLVARSGPNALEREGEDSRSQLRELRRFGFEADYGSMYFPRDRGSDVQYAESIAMLFGNGDGAARGLAFLETTQREQGRGVEDLSAEGLGDEGWGLRGRFFPGAPPTYFYAWRVGNAVLVFAIAGGPAVVSEREARLFADEMDMRTRP